MDSELLLFLWVFWSGTTLCLICYLPMFFANRGESFHPHCVSLRYRHVMYEVVDARTECKFSHVVSSISSFVAPRGSTSSNFFKMLSVQIAISGFLGTHRWNKVGAANDTVSTLSLVGFACLLLVPIFDFDVLPQRFLVEKLMSSKWLLDKILKHRGLKRPFAFRQSEMLKFVRASPLIYHLYNENHPAALQFAATDIGETTLSHHRGRSRSRSRDRKSGGQEKSRDMTGGSSIGKSESRLRSRSKSKNKKKEQQQLRLMAPDWEDDMDTSSTTGTPRQQGDRKEERNYWGQIYGLLHMIGAIGFVFCTTAAVILQEPAESVIVAPVAAGSFTFFCLLGYLTGNYIPLFHVLRGWILPWNPFLHDPHFMYKLSLSLDAYLEQRFHLKPEHEYAHELSHLHGRKVDIAIVAKEAAGADLALDNPSLRYARHRPAEYLQLMGYLLVMSELIALLTPCVAIGLQWICALCHDPPLRVMMDLFALAGRCISSLGGMCEIEPHCVVRPQ